MNQHDDSYAEDDDPFEQPGGRDIFHEQRMLQDKIQGRPERMTYEQEVERSSYQASVNSSSNVGGSHIEDADGTERRLREEELV